jgi:hypothetical protein
MYMFDAVETTSWHGPMELGMIEMFIHTSRPNVQFTQESCRARSMTTMTNVSNYRRVTPGLVVNTFMMLRGR